MTCRQCEVYREALEKMAALPASVECQSCGDCAAGHFRFQARVALGPEKYPDTAKMVPSENCQDKSCVFFGWHYMMHPGGNVCDTKEKA